jgi:hypothetical protein
MSREREKLELLKQFRQSVGPDLPWTGLYTIGEIGRVEEHNLRYLCTSVVLALSCRQNVPCSGVAIDRGEDYPPNT